MTRRTLSRRQLLGAMSTIGGAAALGGVGTMAYFADEEEFANNRLVAGSLDLKLAWQELYFGAAAETAFDSGAVTAATLLGNEATTTEEYPGDGAGASFETLSEEDPCSRSGLYADTPADLDPTSSGSHRPRNEDTYDEQATEPKPLISVQDAKPGDFGFTRFRLLLCDNPGFIWVTGGVRSTSENGLTEPERKDPDQVGAAGGPGGIADEIRVRLVQAKSGTALEGLFGSLSATSGPELVQEVFDLFDLRTAATLREFSNAVSTPRGFQLDGDPFDGGSSAAGTVHSLNPDVFLYDISGGGARQESGACFDGNANAGQVGLIWALPVDHANELQTDDVAVDVEFYTEQCRHNDEPVA